ncbi:hypothetical protein [Eikenella halliae]|uniref:hypothetical protein n=1 Tax=Eikenella halliae TaxID=1795832 RepID=UPI0012E7D71D|nr:hypothetical protein [Eikenella halliae]
MRIIRETHHTTICGNSKGLLPNIAQALHSCRESGHALPPGFRLITNLMMGRNHCFSYMAGYLKTSAAAKPKYRFIVQPASEVARFGAANRLKLHSMGETPL